MRVLTFLLLLLSFAAFSQTGAKDLERLYLANPGLATQGNPEILKKEAAKTLGAESAERIFKFVSSDLDAFSKARSDILPKLASKGLRPVVVSGQSVTGMVAAAIAAQSGHPVRVYDSRMRYTRDIQWSSRQSVADVLASIDPKLAEKYHAETSKFMSRGYLSFGDDGHNTRYPVVDMQKPDARRVPQVAKDMLLLDDVATVQTRIFEKLMHEYLSTHPNVIQKKGKIEIGPIDPKTGEHKIVELEDVTPEGQKEKVYKKVTEGNPITVIAEGAGSSNRTALGIKSVPISPKRLQVAGVVHIENGAEIVTHYRNEGPGRLITGSMGTTGSGKRWVVGDIDETKITPKEAKFGSDPTHPEYVKERARLLEEEFKRMAAGNMRMPVGDLKDVKVSGAIEGQPLQTFELQQHISTRAHSGSNVLLLGDAVGNGHWSVGGGMHVGAVSHGERFKQFLTNVDGGEKMSTAAARYSAGALQDTRAWGESGLYYFYNNLTHEEAAGAYQEAAKLYKENKIKTPERALELMTPDGRTARTVKSVRLKCDDIILRILGDK